MEELAKGTIEYLPVVVSDRLGVLTTLDGLTLQFRIDNEDDSAEVAWTSCNSDGMTVLPLIDTTALDELTYKLYVKVSIGPEFPVLGPFEFQVV